MNLKCIKKQLQLVALSLMFVGMGNALNAQNTFPTTGNVGIGILQPQYLLDVNGIGRFRMIYANKGNFGIYPNQAMANTLNVYTNMGQGDTSVLQVGIRINEDLFDIFNVWNNGTVTINKFTKADIFVVKFFLDEYFKIDNDGKVTINANGFTDNLVIKNRQTGLDAFVVNRNGKLTIKAKNYDSHLLIQHLNGADLFSVNNHGKVFIRTQYNYDPLIIKRSNNQELFSLSNAGNLVLNNYTGSAIVVKTSPYHKILQLEHNGLLRAREIKVDEANWPDYVFNKNYQLLDLEQLAQYILKHKHLPGVPSAKVIKAEGLSLGKTQALLMQKIEELTLYTIEQNTQIKSLEKENQQLKSELKKVNDRLDKIEAMLNQK